MDIHVSSPVLALLLAALFIFFSIGRKRRQRPSLSRGDDRRLPPSPLGLPLLGHLPLLGSLPHRKLWAMAKVHGPVMLLRLGRVPTVVVSSAAAAQEVMKTRDLAFASRPRVRMAERLVYGCDIAFAPYGEHWRQARRVCVLHLLSQHRVHAFRHGREQEAAAMVDRVRGTGDATINVTALLNSYTAAFGGDGRYGLRDGEKLTNLFSDFEGLLGTVTMGEFVPWLAWVDTLMGLDAKALQARATCHRCCFPPPPTAPGTLGAVAGQPPAPRHSSLSLARCTSPLSATTAASRCRPVASSTPYLAARRRSPRMGVVASR